MSRVVVIGAGLGGLGAALRLQGAGARGRRRRAAPGARRPRLPTARRRRDVGHGAVADHDAVGARGDVRGRRARPALGGAPAAAGPDVPPDPLGGRRTPQLDFAADAGALARRGGPSSRPRTREQVGPFLERAAADLRAGHPRGRPQGVRRPLAEFAALVPPDAAPQRADAAARVRLRASSSHPRVREAFSFHSLFIGGNPFRVPAIYGALVYLQVARRRLVPPTAGSTPSWRRWRDRSTSAAAWPSRRSSKRARPRHPACGLADGSRVAPPTR